MMTAVGYVRVSTEEQAREGISLAHQRAKIEAYADLHDIELVDVVADEGVSAKNVEGRPGASKVIEMAKGREVDAVIVYKLDRMFRNAQEALNIATQFNRADVAFHSVTEKLDTQSAMGKFFFTIMAACAEMERNLISERTRDALRFKKASGEVYNHAPYGWDAVDGRLVENVNEQATIQRLIGMHNAGYPLQRIAAILNQEEIPTKKDGRWHAQTVKNVLFFATFTPVLAHKGKGHKNGGCDDTDRA